MSHWQIFTPFERLMFLLGLAMICLIVFVIVVAVDNARCKRIARQKKQVPIRYPTYGPDGKLK